MLPKSHNAYANIQQYPEHWDSCCFPASSWTDSVKHIIFLTKTQVRVLGVKLMSPDLENKVAGTERTPPHVQYVFSNQGSCIISLVSLREK